MIRGLARVLLVLTVLWVTVEAYRWTFSTPASRQQMTVLKEAVRDAPPEEKIRIVEQFSVHRGVVGEALSPPTPWIAYSQVTTQGVTVAQSGGLSGLPAGRYASLEACQTALHTAMDRRISSARANTLRYPSYQLKVGVIDRPHYMAVTEQQGKMAPRTSESLCYLQAASPEE